MDPALATLSLGSGSDQFDALTPGQMMPFYAGFQGAHHVYGSINTSGVFPGSEDEINAFFFGEGTSDLSQSPSTEYTVVTADNGETLGSAARTAPLMPVDESTYDATRIGDIVVLDIGAMEVDQLENREVEFSVRVTDVCGASLESSINVVLFQSTELR